MQVCKLSFCNSLCIPNISIIEIEIPRFNQEEEAAARFKKIGYSNGH